MQPKNARDQSMGGPLLTDKRERSKPEPSQHLADIDFSLRACQSGNNANTRLNTSIGNNVRQL